MTLKLNFYLLDQKRTNKKKYRKKKLLETQIQR